jgi:hypothetical protein
VDDIKDPDDFFRHDDDKGPLKGRVIDVTPKKKRQGIDFDDDKPIVEQALEQHELDRTDKKHGFFEGSEHVGLGVLMILFVALLIIIILFLIF